MTLRSPFDETRFLRLRDEAIALLADNPPYRPWVPRVLASFSDADIHSVIETKTFSDDLLTTIAKKVEIEPAAAVRGVIVRYVMNDLEDYAGYFRYVQGEYEKDPTAIDDFVEEVRKTSGYQRYFLLHRAIHTWDVRDGDMLVAGMGQAKRQGYLVATGRAFVSHAELLRVSRADAWPKWETLWKCF